MLMRKDSPKFEGTLLWERSAARSNEIGSSIPPSQPDTVTPSPDRAGFSARSESNVKGNIPPGEGESKNPEPEDPTLLRQMEKEAAKKTETPEFKKWFGESKVVDETGKPKIVFSGLGATPASPIKRSLAIGGAVAILSIGRTVGLARNTPGEISVRF